MNSEEQEKVQAQAAEAAAEAQNEAAEAAENSAAEAADTAPGADSEQWQEAGEITDDAAAAEKVEISAEALLQAEVASLKDQLLRKEADYQNYRKRMAREVSDARRIGLVETITPFLQVFDLFEMAMKAAETSDNVAALKQGLEMILAQYGKTIDELGVQKFDAVGSTFDPMWHDAVAYENDPEAPEGTIIKQWNCGYKMGDRLLRPARVIVSGGPAREAAGEAEEKAENAQ
ncbi:MAG: nucleotide exchange factor GrpE [Lentisphaeria bacterium]|nr:nucleotide exchange factor GrpE [Lentisphaeria bacterium]